MNVIDYADRFKSFFDDLSDEELLRLVTDAQAVRQLDVVISGKPSKTKKAEKAASYVKKSKAKKEAFKPGELELALELAKELGGAS